MDVIEKCGDSIIQHGKYNDRIYLMKMSVSDYPEIADDLCKMASRSGYSKIFAKVPCEMSAAFFESGYVKEAYIPNFFKNGDTVFVSRYLNEERRLHSDASVVDDILKVSLSKKPAAPIAVPPCFSIAQMEPVNAAAMADLYKTVFETYPFPIDKPDYLIETMRDNIIYYGIYDKDNQLAALSSCETDRENSNAEMTDFACLEKFRGNDFALILLNHMEKELKKSGYKTFYTIARAVSYGMNITFAKTGYRYAGTLINNTNISGGLESMNVWYKNINF